MYKKAIDSTRDASEFFPFMCFGGLSAFNLTLDEMYEATLEWRDDRFKKFYCGICGKRMVWYVDTLLCPKCDWEVIYMLRFEHDYRKEINDKILQNRLSIWKGNKTK